MPDEKERRKIDRYIDVTKASFLFGGRSLLVEGVAEALLIPVVAEKFVLHDDSRALRRFRSTTFVPIDGVDFEPYLRFRRYLKWFCTSGPQDEESSPRRPRVRRGRPVRRLRHHRM